MTDKITETEIAEAKTITPDAKKKKSDKTPKEAKFKAVAKPKAAANPAKSSKTANKVAEAAAAVVTLPEGLPYLAETAPGTFKDFERPVAGVPDAPTSPIQKVGKAPAPDALISYDPFSSHVQVGNSVRDLISVLPKLDDLALVEMFRNTVGAEKAMFVIRGATAHEIIKRAEDAGKKFGKTNGGGIDSVINEIAKDVGIDGKTLYADYKVFEEFGGYLTEQLTTAPEAIMPREYYVLAIKTGMSQELPMSILEYFEERRLSTNGYFTDHARRDVKLLNEGKTIEQVMEMDATNRAEIVADKNKKAPAKTGSSAPIEKTLSVSLPDNAQVKSWYKQILAKYGTFESWYTRKCTEEFGTEIVA